MVSYLVHYDTLLESARGIITKMIQLFYYKIRQKLVTKYTWFSIRKCDSLITKCNRYLKMCLFYYKMRHSLQNASGNGLLRLFKFCTRRCKKQYIRNEVIIT